MNDSDRSGQKPPAPPVHLTSAASLTCEPQNHTPLCRSDLHNSHSTQNELIRNTVHKHPKAHGARPALAAEFPHTNDTIITQNYNNSHINFVEKSPALLAAKFGDTGRVRDAYIAATAEDLARKHNLVLPRWTEEESRKLHSPWFASTLASLRAVLILESPPGFRSRNLFVSENALSRA